MGHPCCKSSWIRVSKKDWRALVKFFRTEENILSDSYSTPGKDDWVVYYKEHHPKAWAIYDAARKAARRSGRM